MPVANGDRGAINTVEPWQDSGLKALAKSEEDAKDIFVDDLTATLEAHRASNRATVVRKIDNHGIASPFKYPIAKPHKDGKKDGQNKVKKELKIKKVKVNPLQMWPADSVQAKSEHGKKGSIDVVRKSQPLEYNGSIQGLKKPWKISHVYMDMDRQRPWLAYMENEGGDARERFVLGNHQEMPFADIPHSLTNEIKAYEAYMKLSPQEEAASKIVISDVNSVAQKESSIKALTLLGSRSTGLASPISDFDFSLTAQVSPLAGSRFPPRKNDVDHSQPSRRENKNYAVKALRKMSHHFKNSSKFSNIELLRYARVPILRSKHVPTGLAVQIQTMASYQASYEYTLASLSEFPSLRPLYVVLRYFLELRGLATVFEGGLGSYSILIMIVTALKHSRGKFTSDDLGGQLLLVLGFYGKANLYKVGFSADPPRVFKKRETGDSSKKEKAEISDPQISGIGMMKQTLYPRKPYLLCLQDPADSLNDLGKNAYAIKHIQATFEHAKETLQSVLEEKNETSGDRAYGKTFSYLDHLLRADYRTFGAHRSQLGIYSANLGTTDDQSDSKGEDSEETGDTVEPMQRSGRKSRRRGGRKRELKAFQASARPAWYSKVHLIRKVRVISGDNQNTEIDGKMRGGINDDEYGWEPSSPSSQKTLFEAITTP